MKDEKQVRNTSGLRPLGKAILLKTYEIKSGIIAIPDHVKDKEVVAEQRAVVVDIGPWAWGDEPAPRAKIGDRVLFTRFAGYVAVGPKDGQTYRVVNDRDIFLGIEDE